MDSMINDTKLFKSQLLLLLEAVEDFQTGPKCDWSFGEVRDEKYNLSAACEDVIAKLEYMIENYNA